MIAQKGPSLLTPTEKAESFANWAQRNLHQFGKLVANEVGEAAAQDQDRLLLLTIAIMQAKTAIQERCDECLPEPQE